MKLKEGRIGTQETASIVGLALASVSIFTIDSATAYGNGNSTYIWAPMSIAVSFGIFLLLAVSMEKCGQRDLDGMATYCFGKVLGSILLYILVGVLLLDALLLLSRFLSMIHSFIYVDTDYDVIALWLLLPVTLLAFMGLEGIGRTAKCIAYFSGVVVLVGYIWPFTNGEAFRLYPLFGDGAASIVGNTFSNTYKLVPALLAVLSTRGTQGIKTAKKAALAGSIAAFIVCFATQLALGLMYGYAELAEMYFPLYRLNMPIILEGYYQRLDKVTLFLWLLGVLVAAAFYTYSAALLYAKRSGVNDVRPPVFAISVSLACVMLIEHIRMYSVIRNIIAWLDTYAFMIVLAPPLAASVIGLIKCAGKERAGNEAG